MTKIKMGQKIGQWTFGVGVAIALGNAGSAYGATFSANLTGDQVVPGTGSTATGLATFSLNEDETELAYTIALTGVDLKASDRTAPADVNKIHLHAAAAGENGPHTLNIFGLPAEDDDDLVVDYAANTLSGVWDDGDVSDLNGNGIADPNDTKPLTSFLSALKSGGLYVQVHTNRFDSPFPGELRGQVLTTPTASTPEPFGVLGFVGAAGLMGVGLRRRG